MKTERVPGHLMFDLIPSYGNLSVILRYLFLFFYLRTILSKPANTSSFVVQSPIKLIFFVNSSFSLISFSFFLTLSLSFCSRSSFLFSSMSSLRLRKFALWPDVSVCAACKSHFFSSIVLFSNHVAVLL